MNKSLWRAVAASLPVAALAASTLAAAAAPITQSRVYSPSVRQVRPFAQRFRTFASTPTAIGGGATLPIPAYLGASEPSGTTNFGLAGSLFGFFAAQSGGLNVEYCATGSGKGKGVFAGPAGTVDNPCSNAGIPMPPYGFAPPGGTNLRYPALAGTDAPLTQSDYTTFEMDNQSTQLEPVEVPSIVGSIAIYYKPPSGITQRVNFTEEEICKLYDGKMTTFPGSSTKVTLYYRGDGSGTSFNFSNHLANAGLNANNPDCKNFNGSQTFFPNADPKLPSNAVPEQGNSGVVAGVSSGPPGSIGYAETGYILSPASGTNYGTVDGKNPVTNLPEAAASVKDVSGTVLTDQAVIETGGGAGTGPAGHVALTGVPAPGCVQLVNPSAFALPPAGYPIVAVTYLVFYHNGNNGQSAALQRLVDILNTSTDFAAGKITTINPASQTTGRGTTGYSALGSSFNTQLKRVASSCIGA